jgi:hypothetical protein
MFNLPLSTTAHEQFHELQDDIQIMNTDAGNDTWNFPWGNSFATKKVYNLLKGEEITPTSILDIWKTCNIPRQKFFSWLLLQGRLNTKDMMSRKNFYVEFNDCILCNDCPQETIMHMFFECNFSQGFWWAIGIEWNVDMDIHQMIADAKIRYSMSFIMDIIITGCWSLWDQRNNAIFNGVDPNLQRCIIKFRNYFCLNMHRAKPSLREGMQSWLDTL